MSIFCLFSLVKIAGDLRVMRVESFACWGVVDFVWRRDDVRRFDWIGGDMFRNRCGGGDI